MGFFCILLPGEYVKMLYNSRFSDLHSSQKERQLSNLLEASSFVKFQQLLVLRFFCGFYDPPIRGGVETMTPPIGGGVDPSHLLVAPHSGN